MTYTKKFHLPQWVKSDYVRMEDFNDAMARIESGLTTVLKKAEDAIQAAATPPELPFAVGQYTGTGSPLYVDVGFTPSLVMVSGMWASITQGDYSNFDHFFGVSANREPNKMIMRLQIFNTGFVVYGDNYSMTWHPNLNDKDRVYDYIAFR